MSLGRVGREGEWWEKEERLYVCMGREVSGMIGMLGMWDIISLPLSVTKAGGHLASPTCTWSLSPYMEIC